MRIGASLLAYGALLAVAGPSLLAGRAATRRAPRLGVLAWEAATFSTVAAFVAAGLVFALPALPTANLGRFFATCAQTLREATAAPNEADARVAGLVLAGGVLARALSCTVAVLASACRHRRRHAAALRLVAQPAPNLGAVVVDVDPPLVYCLPGRARQVVLTRGALGALSAGELRAVLAHGRAHLTARHHLPLAAVRGLARAFPGVPLFQRAVFEVARLLEMCADDSAAAQHGRDAVAAALRTLSTAATPVATLAAAATATEERLARLACPPRGRLATWTVLTVGVAVLMTGPLLAAPGPVVVAAVHHLAYCPLPAV